MKRVALFVAQVAAWLAFMLIAFVLWVWFVAFCVRIAMSWGWLP